MKGSSSSFPSPPPPYIPRGAPTVIVYKGQLTPEQVFLYFAADLHHPLYKTHVALVHTRFSTVDPPPIRITDLAILWGAVLERGRSSQNRYSQVRKIDPAFLFFAFGFFLWCCCVRSSPFLLSALFSTLELRECAPWGPTLLLVDSLSLPRRARGSDEHVSFLEPGAAAAGVGPQRGDQHPPRQQELDALPRPGGGAMCCVHRTP